jgi:hypothetical protein
MSRLSCSLCVLSNRRDLLLAAARRPELAALYAEVEDALGKPFNERLRMRRILEPAHAPDAPAPGIVLREDPAELAALRAAVRAELAAGSTPRRVAEPDVVDQPGHAQTPACAPLTNPK